MDVKCSVHDFTASVNFVSVDKVGVNMLSQLIDVNYSPVRTKNTEDKVFM